MVTEGKEVGILPELNPEVTRVVKDAFRLVGGLTNGRHGTVRLFTHHGELLEEKSEWNDVYKIGEEEIPYAIAGESKKLIKQLLELAWGVDWNFPFQKSSPRERSKVGIARHYMTNDPNIVVVEEDVNKSVFGEGRNYFHNSISIKRLSLTEKAASIAKGLISKATGDTVPKA